MHSDTHERLTEATECVNSRFLDLFGAIVAAND